MGISKRTQVKVCDVCGNHGFSNALVYCSKCSNTTVHQYCIGISPGSIDDTFDWFCEYCSSSMEFEHLSSYGARTEECIEDFTIAPEMESKQYMNAIVCVEEEIEPLCILPPSSQHRISKLNCIDSLSLDYLLNDREESEEPVSSFMECPVEIMSGVVLLASSSGKIIIQNYREVAYNCVAHQTLILDDSSPKMDKEISTGHSDEGGTVYACQKITNEDGDVQKAIVIGFPTIGTRSFPGIKRKRSTHAKFDLISTLGPNCKRARSKRCKKSTFLGKEVNACKPTLHDAPATGKEGNDQPINGQKPVILKELHPESNIADTSVNINPSKMDGVHVEAFNQQICLLTSIDDTCGSNVIQRASQVDHKTIDQDAHELPLLNDSPSEDGGQQSEKCISSPNHGSGRSEVSTFSSCSSSSRWLAQTNFDGRYIREGKDGIVMPLYCRVCDAKVCEQVMDIEEGEVLHCNTSLFENYDVKEGEVPSKNASHSKVCEQVMEIEEGEVLHCNTSLFENYDVKEVEVPSKNVSHSKGYDIVEWEVLPSNAPFLEGFDTKEREELCDQSKDHDIEEVEILDTNTSSHSKGLSYSLPNSTLQRQPLKCSIVCTFPMVKSGAPTTHIPCGKLAGCLVPTEKLMVEMADFSNKGESLKESITYLDAWKKYDDEIQRLKSNLEDEKNKLKEVVKKNRQQMWKVVYELESTKKELQSKIIELAKKTDKAKKAKKLATKERRKKEAYKDRLKACRKRH